MLEILEDHDIEVVYDFDRLHENIADKYWASATKAGFQLSFDAEQVADAIFLYLAPLEGFDPVDCSDLDVPLFASVSDVEAHCVIKGLRFATGQVRPGMLLAERDWVRIDSDRSSIHYDFRKGVLSVVTISKPWTR